MPIQTNLVYQLSFLVREDDRSNTSQRLHLMEIHQELKEVDVATRACLRRCMLRQGTTCDATIIVLKMATIGPEVLLS